jgi:hypothetical protein
MIRLFVGLVLTIATGIGSVMAGSFSMGESASAIEYGQGVYKVKACDDWIRVNMTTSETGQFGAPEGLSALTGISIASLDTRACANTEFTITALDSENNLLPMYRTDGFTGMCNDIPCAGPTEVKLQIDGSGNLTSSIPASYYQIDQDPLTAMFQITFVNPAILGNSVGRLNIQSTAL